VKSRRLGVARYRDRIKALFPNADELHDSYAEWVKSAEASVKRITLRYLI
jgi:hypothetical protein